MTLTDIDVAVRSEGKVQGLPKKSLSLGFIPVPPVPSHSDGHEQLPFGTYLFHCRTIRVADPDIVLRVDCHAVRLFLVANDVLADGADKLVIRVELKQLRLPDGVALKDPKLSL